MEKNRGFVFAFHATHGLLILRAWKKKKGSHWQLPGGHVDPPEIEKLGLDKAFLAGAKRELFEETGLKLPAERFVPVYVTKTGGDGLECFELKGRRYFLIELYDEDSLEFGESHAMALVLASASFVHCISIHRSSLAEFDLVFSIFSAQAMKWTGSRDHLMTGFLSSCVYRTSTPGLHSNEIWSGQPSL